jgi:hypothetical protein
MTYCDPHLDIIHMRYSIILTSKMRYYDLHLDIAYERFLTYLYWHRRIWYYDPISWHNIWDNHLFILTCRSDIMTYLDIQIWDIYLYGHHGWDIMTYILTLLLRQILCSIDIIADMACDRHLDITYEIIICLYWNHRWDIMNYILILHMTYHIFILAS